MSELTVHYMRWAKGHQHGTHDLASSGMPPVDPRRAGLLRDETLYLEAARGGDPGLPSLQQALADWIGGTPAMFQTGIGTSGINLLALRAIAAPGDTVLVETPVYEPLWKLPELFGMHVSHFRRDAFGDSSLRLEELERAWRPGTTAVVLSNLFNPGGNRLSNGELEMLADFARDRKLRVLLDEVYMPFCDGGHGHRQLSFLRSPLFISTLSLTKGWGLSCLRLGIMACRDEDIVRRADHLNDSVNVVHPFVSEHAGRQLISNPERLDLLLLPHLERIEENFRQLKDQCEARGIAVSQRSAGLCCFLRIPGEPELGTFCDRLLAERGVVVVDGGYFQAPGHLRIGLGATREHFDRGLEILLDQLGRLGH